MRPIWLGPLAAGLIGISALALIVVRAPSSRKAPASIANTSPSPAASAVPAGEFKLVSVNVDLPADAAVYPDGPYADVINANCISCHSASMALTQPVLSADQWKATVTKMREVYHAPIAEKDVPAIVTYLTSMPTQTAVSPSGSARDPISKTAPDASGRRG